VPGGGKILISDGTNIVASTPTFPNTTPGAGKVLVSDGTNWQISTPTFPNASATALKHIRSDGTNWIASTATISDTPGTAGKVLISDGTNWITSTPTFPNASATSGKMIKSDGTNWVASTETYDPPGTSGNAMLSDGTNWKSVTCGTVYVSAYATATQSPSTTEYYMLGSTITVAAGIWKAGGAYHCVFDMFKAAVGTGAITLSIRMGTLGTVSDALIGSIAFLAGTANSDTGIFDVWVTFRAVGSGTTAIIVIGARCTHSLAATGLVSSGASGIGIPTAVASSGFNSTTQTKIGVTITGGTGFAGTNSWVQSDYAQ
jgi:hypothetical protein